jgi:hypothetical protein
MEEIGKTSFIMKLFHFVRKTSNNGTVWQTSGFYNQKRSSAPLIRMDPNAREYFFY